MTGIGPVLPLLLAVALVTQPVAPLRVLFIGNSLTYTNDVPALVSALGRANRRPLVCEQVAGPNLSLEDHWQRGDARRAIAEARWDVVLLQQGPSALPESRALLVSYVRRFDAEIRKTGARTGLFMVWPAQPRRGDFPEVSRSYTAASRAVKGLLVPAGDAWREAWRIDSRLPLYGADGFHPSPLGAQLAALVIFEALTGEPATTLPFEGLPEAQSAVLRTASARVLRAGP